MKTAPTAARAATDVARRRISKSRPLLRAALFSLLLLAARESLSEGVGPSAANARPRSPDTLRVWFGSPAPKPPFPTWETASRSIQHAIDAADSGDCVLIRADTAEVYASAQIRCHDGCGGSEKSVAWSVIFMKNGVTVRGEDAGPLPIVCGYDTTRTATWIDGSRRAVLERVRLRGGGALFAGSIDSTNAVRAAVFEACKAREGGAALLRGDAAPLIEGNLFVGNGSATTGSGYGGGAISVLASSPPKRALIRRNIFRGNGAGGAGGAIRIQGGTATIEANLFEGNRAGLDGGAIAIVAGKPLILGNIFRGNYAEEHGGALGIGRGSGFRNLRILFNVFDRDSAAAGGGMAIAHGGDNPAEMLVANNTFVACRAESAGSALLVEGPALERQRLYVNRNLFAGVARTRSRLVACTASGLGAPIDSFACNVFWEGKPDSVAAPGCEPAISAGNLVADPRFVAGDTLFAVGPDSPCAPGRAPGGDAIGAERGSGPNAR